MPWAGKSTVPLQEEEVIQAIRLLTRFGEAAQTADINACRVPAGTGRGRIPTRG